VIATIVYVDLHSVIGTALPWLSDTMAHSPRVSVATLAAAVVKDLEGRSGAAGTASSGGGADATVSPSPAPSP